MDENLSLKELCERCNIACSKCLDTGKLWKNRDHPLAHLDLRGPYDIIRCDSCSDGGWLHCSHTNQIEEIGIRLFNKDDNDERSRKLVVNDIYYRLLINEKCVKQQIENERLKKIQQEQEEQDRLENERLKKLQREREEQDRLEEERLKKLEREQKEEQLKKDAELKELERKQEEEKRNKDKEIQDIQDEADKLIKKGEIEQHKQQQLLRIEKEKQNYVKNIMNDNSSIPIYHTSKSGHNHIITKKGHLNMELGKLVEKTIHAIEAYGNDLSSLVDTIKDIKIDFDFSSNEEEIKKKEVSKSNTLEGFPVYLILTISSLKMGCDCKLLEWCGFDFSETKLSIDYDIYFPRNNKAVEECEIDFIQIIQNNRTSRNRQNQI
jgi:hypothetical protein